MTLEWTDPRDDAITGYQVRYWETGADRPAWSDDSVVEIGATTIYTVVGLMSGTRYTFEVRAVAGEVPGASDSVTVRTAPPPPANLRGTVADGIVVLTWDAPALAAGSVTGYQVLWRFPGDNAEGGFRVLAATGAMVRTYTDEDVGFDDSINYQVKAMYGETLSRGSAEVLVYVPAPPPRPEGLMATAGDGEVTLTWDVPGDHAITGYLVRYRTRGSGTLGSIVEDDVASGERTMTRTVEDLTNGIEYTFQVQLRNAGGYSEASRATATPGARPAAPGNLTALPGDGEVTLTWRDPENPYITRYQVRWAESSMALPEWSDAHIIDDSGPATTEHIVEGLNNGRKYTFEVRARVDDVEGLSASVMATLPPPAPDNLTALPGDGVATLSWRDPENPYITRYQVRWAESSMALPEWSDAHIIDDSGPATTEHIVEGLNNGRKYTFEVRARVDDVEGLSASVTAVPVPDPPVWVGSPVVGDGAVTLTWEDPEDNAVTAYQHRHTVSRGTDQPDWMGVSWTTIADAGVRDLTVTGLTNGVEYTIQVRAVAGDYPGKTASVTVMLDVPPPAAPDNLTALAGDRAVTLRWDNPDAPDVTGYEIRYGVGEAPAEWTVISVSPEPGASTTTRDVPGLTNGIEYTFEVRAMRGSVQGLPASVRATPDLPPPRNLNADLVDGAVALTWDAAATDAASITGYRILRRRPDVDAEVDFHPIGATGATETRYVDAGVEAGHRYAYQVKTQRDNYLSGSSNVASIDVPAPPPPPGNLLAREDDGMVTLTWTDPGDDAVTGYQVRYGDDPTSLPESWHDIAVTTTHPVPGLTNGIEYTFEVRAMRGSVQGLPARVRATPGNRAPANLEAAVDNGAVALTWEAPTADVASVSSYHFHYSLSSDGVNVMRHGTFGTPDADTRTVDTIARERGYPYIAYKVRAKRGEEFSDWSNTVTVMFHDGPPPPEGLTAAAGVGQVRLEWDDAGDETLTGYQVRYGYDPASLPERWGDIAVTTRHEVPGLTNGVEYTFEVRAVAGDDEGASARVKATPVPAPPANFRAAPGNRKVMLTWNNPGDDAVSAYEIRYGVNGAWDPDWTEIDPSGPNTTRHEVTGLTNGIEYTFEVRAKAGMVHGDPARATATPRPTVPPPLPPPLTVSCPENQELTINDRIDVQATASGGRPRYRFSMRRAPTGIGIDESTGEITGEPRQTGTFDVTVTVRDADNRSASCGFRITVNRRPPPPCPTLHIDPISNKTVAVNTRITITPRVQVNCQIIYTMSGRLPPGVSFNSATGVISGTVGGSPDTYDVTVTATAEDNSGNTDDEAFTITVVPPFCDQIVIDPISNKTVAVNTRITITPRVQVNCQITYTMSGRLPPGVSFNSATGVISGTVGGSPDTYDLTVTATAEDNSGNTDDEAFTITVVPPLCDQIVIDPISNKTVAVNTRITITPRVQVNCQIIYTMSGRLPPGVSFNSATGVISGTVGGSPDTYDLTVTATAEDNSGNTDDEAFTITVVPPLCDQIVIDPISNKTVAVNTRITITPRVQVNCQIIYTMSGRLPPGVSFNSATGVISGTVGGSPDTYDVTVTATAEDNSGNTDDEAFTITVECPDITVTQSPDPVEVPAGGTATVTVSAEGGCGTKTFGNPGGLGWVRKTGSNEYTVEPPSGTAPGPYTFGVTATDAAGNTGPGTINVTVACPDISVGGLSNVRVEVRQNMPSMTASASGGQGPYTYRKETGPEWVNVSTAGVISGRAPNMTDTYTVTVKATDAGRCWGTTTFEITVVNPPLKIADIRDVEATVGQEMPARAASASGGQSPYTFTMSGKPSWVNFNTSSGRISGTPTSTGTSTATVTVTDDKDVTATTPSFQLRVSAPLTIASISDVVVTWHLDMNPIQVSVSGGRSPYTYDLESEPTGISISSSGSIGGTPTQLGSATVTVVVDDQDDRRVTTSFSMTVARPGDFNGDGRRDAADAKLFNKKMGLGRSDTGYDRRMDLNKDGTINYADFVMLTGYIESDAAAQSGSGS